MGIEYRGDGNFRFRVQKDKIIYKENYYYSKKISEKDIKQKNWPKEVELAHNKFEINVLEGKIGANENMKFAELAQLVMDEEIRPHRRKNTITMYLMNYNNHILEEFGDIPINKIKKLAVQQFANKKLKTMAVSSVRQMIGVMRATFNIAIDWEITLKTNPCSKIKLPKIPTKNCAELLSAAEIARLFDAIEREPEMYRVIFLTAIGVGMRQGEILGLSIPKIDFNTNLIDIPDQYVGYYEDNKLKHEIADPKTDNSIRTAYMPDFVSTALKEYIKNLKITDKEQHLFVNPKTGKIYDHNALYRRFKKLLKINDINPALTFHDLRHLKGSMMASSGADVVSIAAKLGDTVETVSKTYLHSIDKVEKEATDKFEDFVKKLRAK
jgi:integrase